jgi:hypothetical protein
MPAWPASLIADLDALAAAWRSGRGGWRAAWRDASQFLAHRRALVDTQAETRDGRRVVLRTRVRLNGDIQTDILRCWLNEAPRQSIEELAKTHFQSVAVAARGWSAVLAGIRLGSLFTVAAGAIPGSTSAIRLAPQAEWGSLIPAVLTNWWVLSSIATAAVCFLVRRALRLWLRRTFRAGLSMGQAL